MSDREPNVFERIIAGDIPADVLYDDDRVIAFRDVNPQAPVHVLVVPKTAEYANVTELAGRDPELLAYLIAIAQKIADDECGGQFRLLFNTGADAGQTIFHVHAHVLGGHLEEGSLDDR